VSNQCRDVPNLTTATDKISKKLTARWDRGSYLLMHSVFDKKIIFKKSLTNNTHSGK